MKSDQTPRKVGRVAPRAPSIASQTRRARSDAPYQFAVILLGAGASSRMGRPKLLLPWRDTTIIGHLLSQWQALGAAQIAVVLRPGDLALTAELDRLNFSKLNRIENPQPERGMFSSIVCAANWTGWHVNVRVPFRSGAKAAAVQTLRDCETSPNRAKRLDCGAFTAAFPPPPAAANQIQPELSRWAIALGDQPQLQTETLRQLLEFSPKNPDAVCQPQFAGRARHPVVLPRAVFEALKNSPAPTLKDFLKLVPCRGVQLEINDPGLTLDLDTPEDYIKAQASIHDA
jgi:molybdenum cofactor cytidylyltransferase